MTIDILLVDDNPADVLYTREVFEDAGFTGCLHVVRDGVEALAFLDREGEFAAAPRPDVVLLDLNMPRLGGLEVLAHLRAHKTLRDLFVIVTTASAREVDVWRAQDTGASAYLPKPVEPSEVLALLASPRATLREYDQIHRPGQPRDHTPGWEGQPVPRRPGV